MSYGKPLPAVPRGIIHVPVTPFTPDNRLDLDTFGRVIEFLLAHDAASLCINLHLAESLNLTLDERKLLAIALSGQPELANHLARHEGLIDRIALWLELEPLAESEAAALLDHRLRTAGFSGARSPFSPETASAAWRIARGLPRRLTAIARGAMEVASERGSTEVSVADVEAARRRVPPDPTRSPASAPQGPADPGRAGARPLQEQRRWPWAWFAR